MWIAHGSGSADRATVDKHDRVLVPPGEKSYHIRRVWLTDEEEAGYYFGFSNEGLWPLCHVAFRRPVFRQEHWEGYKEVNALFADRAAWAERALRNIAGMGPFSSDRTIAEYVERVWSVKSLN